jgi:hypothetical protein
MRNISGNYIKLNFSHPYHISPLRDLDTIVLHFKDNSTDFIRTKSGEIVGKKYRTLKYSLPHQVEDN